MLKKRLLLWIGWIVLIPASHCIANPLTPAQQTLVTSCGACHGADGNTPVSQWPKLAGQYSNYTIKQIQDFKKGEQGPRYNPIMYPLVINLTDADIEALAQYYANLSPNIGAAQASLVKPGERIYQGGDISRGIPACSACHGPAGEGNAPAKFPRLSGQNSEYITTQLTAFKQAKRSNDPGSMMRTIAWRLTDEDIKALSSYISGLY